ncbi:hypothetical protein GCM10010302_53650 [Streptomyces polychromogenes]|uniref:Uncharacterized protein n=1 Tax=Streptomyces polychromogenes TaxID=67342 RepID=A0ABN0VK12_9ACTN
MYSVCRETPAAFATSTIRTAGQGRAHSAASAAFSKDSRAADNVASPACRAGRLSPGLAHPQDLTGRQILSRAPPGRTVDGVRGGGAVSILFGHAHV